jgi:hypothetical protein
MGRLILGLELQPQFPHEDLTLGNANMLEVLLADIAIFDQSHAGAEQAVWLYRVGHPAIGAATARVFAKETIRQIAIADGVATYEAIAGLVRPAPPPYNLLRVNREARDVAIGAPDSVYEYMVEAEETFRASLPKAAGVVIEIAGRTYGNRDAAFVLHGAALACQMELEVGKQ